MNIFRQIYCFLLFSFLPIGLYAQSEEVPQKTKESTNWFSLFNGKYKEAPYGLSLGYVNKVWTTDFGSHILHENLWGQENKRLHGVQVGVIVQPCLPFGVGIHSGLFYEYYWSVSQVVEDAGYDDFSEHSLYLPLHGMFRIPFTRDVSLSFFGGLGINVALLGSYNEKEEVLLEDGTYGKKRLTGAYQEYGTTGEWPKRWNAQWELGGSFRFKVASLSFTYSRGLTNHHFYRGYKTTQDKIAISLVFYPDFLD